jgi:hypothetical protein
MVPFSQCASTSQPLIYSWVCFGPLGSGLRQLPHPLAAGVRGSRRGPNCNLARWRARAVRPGRSAPAPAHAQSSVGAGSCRAARVNPAAGRRSPRGHRPEPGVRGQGRSSARAEPRRPMHVRSRGRWGTEVQLDEMLGSRPEPPGDVVARDDKIVPVLGLAPDQDVEMRDVGVPAIDRRPVEEHADITFNPGHEVANIREMRGVLARDDEAEVASVVFAGVDEIMRSIWSLSRPKRVPSV